MAKISEQISDLLPDYGIIFSWLVILAVLIYLATIIYGDAVGRVNSDFILIGPCDSGKTSIFVRLLYNRFPSTRTTLVKYVGIYKPKLAQNMNFGYTPRLVDMPCYCRLPWEIHEYVKNSVRGIIYVIDSQIAHMDINSLKESIFYMLLEKTFSEIPLVIVCNKQDLENVDTPEDIKDLLKEGLLDGQIAGFNESGLLNPVAQLSRYEKRLIYEKLETTVSFVGVSAKVNVMYPLIEWIDWHI